MANKQIVDFNQKTTPSADDYYLIQDDGDNLYKKIRQGDMIKRKAAIHFVIGSGSTVPSTGIVGHLYLPLDTKIEIKGWRLSSHDGTAGSIQIDLWHDQNRSSVTNDDSICGNGNEPELINQSENNETNIAAVWDVSTLIGGCLVVNLDSAATITQATLCLDIEISPNS